MSDDDDVSQEEIDAAVEAFHKKARAAGEYPYDSRSLELAKLYPTEPEPLPEVPDGYRVKPSEFDQGRWQGKAEGKQEVYDNIGRLILVGFAIAFVLLVLVGVGRG